MGHSEDRFSHDQTHFYSQVQALINKAAQPGLTSVCVDWEQHGADVPGPVQAPRQITALFSGSRQVVYGYVPNCLMVGLLIVKFLIFWIYEFFCKSSQEINKWIWVNVVIVQTAAEEISCVFDDI